MSAPNSGYRPVHNDSVTRKPLRAFCSGSPIRRTLDVFFGGSAALFCTTLHEGASLTVPRGSPGAGHPDRPVRVLANLSEARATDAGTARRARRRLGGAPRAGRSGPVPIGKPPSPEPTVVDHQDFSPDPARLDYRHVLDSLSDARKCSQGNQSRQGLLNPHNPHIPANDE